MAIGKQIRLLREQLGLTLEQLSELSGVELGTISALELRDSKRTQFAGPLAAALGVTIEQLSSDGPPGSLTESAPSGRAPKVAATSAKWPFKRVSLEQVAALPPALLEDIEDYIEMKIAKAKPPKGGQNKQAA